MDRTAILHVDDARNLVPNELDRALRRALDGVVAVTVAAAEAFISVRFDADRTGMAEIVRCLEDRGSVVLGVAERP